MKSRTTVLCCAAIAMAVLGVTAWADQIVLNDGTVYSGKFVRGDGRAVEFRILGRVESFNLEDVARIVFKTPEGEKPAAARAAAPAPSQKPPTVHANPVEAKPPTARSTPAAPALAAKGPVASPATTDAHTDDVATIPEGTPIVIRTSTEIDTDRNRVGDIFDASLDKPLIWANRTIVPRGATVKGRIAYAKESGRLTGKSELILELTEMVVEGKSYRLRTADYYEAGSSRGTRTAATVGGTAALGAIIGAIAGGGKGAAIGAASGGAVGAGVQVLTKGEVLRIPAETILEFKLDTPLNLDRPHVVNP